jgi:hypothetical protein
MKRLLITLLLVIGCEERPTSPVQQPSLSISGRWRGTTSNLTVEFEVGQYREECGEVPFGGGARPCVQRAEVTGTISVGTENATVTGSTTPGSLSQVYGSVSLFPARYIERGDNGCPVNQYEYIARMNSGEITGNLISSCEGFKRTLPLTMKPVLTG